MLAAGSEAQCDGNSIHTQGPTQTYLNAPPVEPSFSDGRRLRRLGIWYAVRPEMSPISNGDSSFGHFDTTCSFLRGRPHGGVTACHRAPRMGIEPLREMGPNSLLQLMVGAGRVAYDRDRRQRLPLASAKDTSRNALTHHYRILSLRSTMYRPGGTATPHQHKRIREHREGKE